MSTFTDVRPARSLRQVIAVALIAVLGATLVAIAQPAAAQSGGERIVGGTPATLGEIPHQVFFSYGEFEAYCGGSLIRADVVLTAGHCEPFPGDTVHAGLLERSAQDSAQVRIVEETVVHPGYGSTADFAVVFLETPFELSATLNTIELATAAELAAATEGRTSGWGNTEFAGPNDDFTSDTLLKTTLPIHDDAFCMEALEMAPPEVLETEVAIAAELFPEVPIEEITAVLEELISVPNPLGYDPAFDFCAGGDGVTDGCQGDSGGPFDVQRGDGTWVTAGVTSRGLLCALQGSPGVWAEVPAVSDWIEETIASRQTEPVVEPVEPPPPPVEVPEVVEEAPAEDLIAPSVFVPASSLTTGHVVVADTNGWEPIRATAPAKAAPASTTASELAYTGSNLQLSLVQWALMALAGGLLLMTSPWRRRQQRS